jgi:hypothetical protein
MISCFNSASTFGGSIRRTSPLNYLWPIGVFMAATSHSLKRELEELVLEQRNRFPRRELLAVA